MGGTSEASRTARLLADAGLDAVFSYAGRTSAPVDQPLPVRIGGFGGAQGLTAWLRDQRISHVIDATHPFAAQISRNAIAAAAAARLPILSLQRPPWQPVAGDQWSNVPDIAAAAAALPEQPASVFLAIGKQNLTAFCNLPHRWLLRLVDPPQGALPLPRATAVIARGPFTPQSDEALMRAHVITHVVAKNAGGEGARAKLTAANRLGLPVILIDRPALPPRKTVTTPEQVLDWLHHTPSTLRGV